MAVHIKELIKGFLKEKETTISRQEKIKKTINKFLDKKLKKDVFLKKVYKNKLIFSSTSAQFGYEFNLQKSELLKKIKKELPQIEKIEVTIG